MIRGLCGMKNKKRGGEMIFLKKKKVVVVMALFAVVVAVPSSGAREATETVAPACHVGGSGCHGRQHLKPYE